MWWFYYDKNSAIAVVVLYLLIQKCKQNIAWKVYISSYICYSLVHSIPVNLFKR